MNTNQIDNLGNGVTQLFLLWQMEDVIRMFDFNMKSIQQFLASGGKPIEHKEVLFAYYKMVADEMQAGGATVKGHSRMTQVTLTALEEFHRVLLKEPTDMEYAAAYDKTLPFIAQIRKDGGNPPMSDLELCLKTMYAFITRGMLKTDLEAEVVKGIEQVERFIALFSRKYDQELTAILN